MTEVHVFGVIAGADVARAARRRARSRTATSRRSSRRRARRAAAAALLRAHSRILEAGRRAGDGAAGALRHRDGGRGRRGATSSCAPQHDELGGRLAALDGKVQLTVKGVYDEEALLRGVVAGSPAIAKLRERVRALPEAAGYYERIRLGELIAAEVERAARARRRARARAARAARGRVPARSRRRRPTAPSTPPSWSSATASTSLQRRRGNALGARARTGACGCATSARCRRTASPTTSDRSRHGPDHRTAHAAARARARHGVGRRAGCSSRPRRSYYDERAIRAQLMEHRGGTRSGRDRRGRGRARAEDELLQRLLGRARAMRRR